MLSITPKARQKLAEILKAKNQEVFAIRLRIVGRDTENFLYEFRSVETATRAEEDIVIEMGAFDVFVDPESAAYLHGAVIDFTGVGQGGFKIDNPNPVWTDATARAVAGVVVDQINPALALHGGSVTLVDVRDGIVYIRMNGGCQGCGAAGVTLKTGVERRIKEAVPQIAQVVDLTDHTQGTISYYQQGESGPSPLAE
nr:NifU family protein [Anaerolineae bacterium]